MTFVESIYEQDDRRREPAWVTPRAPDPDAIFDLCWGGMFDARLHRGFELIGRAEDDSRRQEP